MSEQVDGKTVIGVDFGSDSARAILVDAGTGEILASSFCPYARWSKGYASAPSEARFRQHPLDHQEALRTILHGVLDGFARRETVAGIGVDATASTPCLTDASGTPLSLLPECADDPDAMFVLWKDHTAEEEARLIVAAANADSARYCRHNADTYSPENCWGKVWHILRTNPAVAEKAAGVVESCDWLTALLAGGPVLRSRCAAAYKQMWSPAWGGFPPSSFFASLGGTRLAAIRDALAGCRFAPASARAGTLSPAWAEELGLGADVAVGVGNIDAHSGAVGAGCNAGTAAFILGTSGCVMYAVPPEVVRGRMVPGVFGQVPDGIVEGLEGIEMGQSAFGDAYAWTSRLVSKSAAELDGLASALSLDGSIPVATDWFNGRRSPFQDASATAAIKGLSLGTDAARLHYAVVEATAFGIRAIIEHLERNGIRAERHVAIGGIPRKSPFVMQMLSDVTGKTFEVCATGDACALGAAMHAAVASGLYGSVAEAQAKMCAPSCATYCPRPGRGHDDRYETYKSIGGLA